MVTPWVFVFMGIGIFILFLYIFMIYSKEKYIIRVSDRWGTLFVNSAPEKCKKFVDIRKLSLHSGDRVYYYSQRKGGEVIGVDDEELPEKIYIKLKGDKHAIGLTREQCSRSLYRK